MANKTGNPQKENGYTPIANELLEVILKYPFTMYELKTVLCVSRSTYGWSKEKALISYGDISRLTGMCRRGAKKIVDRLVLDKILFREYTTKQTTSNILGLNKKYKEWKLWNCGTTVEASKKPKKLDSYGTGGLQHYGTGSPQAMELGDNSAMEPPAPSISIIKQENNIKTSKAREKAPAENPLSKNPKSKFYVASPALLKGYFAGIVKRPHLKQPEEFMIAQILDQGIPFFIVKQAVEGIMGRDNCPKASEGDRPGPGKSIFTITYFQSAIFQEHEECTHKLEPELELLPESNRIQKNKFDQLMKEFLDGKHIKAATPKH